MKLEILQADINDNRISDPFDCPVARACKRAGYPNCSVVTMFFRPDRKKNYTLDWPPEVSDWIRRHDNMEEVKPAVFEFEWPEKP